MCSSSIENKSAVDVGDHTVGIPLVGAIIGANAQIGSARKVFLNDTVSLYVICLMRVQMSTIHVQG